MNCVKCGSDEIYFERFVCPLEVPGYYCQDCGAYQPNVERRLKAKLDRKKIYDPYDILP